MLCQSPERLDAIDPEADEAATYRRAAIHGSFLRPRSISPAAPISESDGKAFPARQSSTRERKAIDSGAGLDFFCELC